MRSSMPRGVKRDATLTSEFEKGLEIFKRFPACIARYPSSAMSDAFASGIDLNSIVSLTSARSAKSVAVAPGAETRDRDAGSAHLFPERLRKTT